MICIDSDFIIDYLRGKKEAVDFLAGVSEEIVTTEINVFEVFYGIYTKKEISLKEESVADSFFEAIRVLSLDENCGREGAKIFSQLEKKGAVIEQNDCLIASIIIKNGVREIISKNKKHFSRIKGLNVLSY